MSGEFTSFFVAGGSLPGDAASYVTRDADDSLLRSLQDGEFCYILTSRQMGKSSLMVHTVRRLRAAGVAVAALDLSALGVNLSVEQWYYGLLMRLGRQLSLDETLSRFWLGNSQLGPLQRWMAALRECALL